MARSVGLFFFRACLVGSLVLGACGTSTVGVGHRDLGSGGDPGTPDSWVGGGDLDAQFGDGGCGLVTCASAGATCGPIGDGCGGLIQCGTCAAPQTCGGGGPSVCGGTMGCVKKTCADLGFDCGPAGDGCGGLLDCGTCPTGEGCGVTGKPGVCGHDDGSSSCVKKACADLGFDCGPAGDGCGGLLDCGTCGAGQGCGTGGKAGVCGPAGSCVAQTCDALGYNCGKAGDGCGGMLDCGPLTCAVKGQVCGGGGPNKCGFGGTTTCTGLCAQIKSCTGKPKTTLSGIVYAPNGTLPLYGATVYVPNGTVEPFGDHVSCEQCGARASGDPLTQATTGADGKFTLIDVPAGADIPVIIQLGRWRKKVVIANVKECQDNPVAAGTLRLPTKQREQYPEDNLPKIAVATGSVDALECVLYKLGIDKSEFSDPAVNASARIQLYMGTDSGSYVRGGAKATSGTPTYENALWNNLNTLQGYDQVLLACKASEYTADSGGQANLRAYTDAGGRVFASHYGYAWIKKNSPWNGTADWGYPEGYPGYLNDPNTCTIDQTFAKGKDFATWLKNVGASSTLGSIPISEPRINIGPGGVTAGKGQRWIYAPGSGNICYDPWNGPCWYIENIVESYTFNTPVGAAPASQCGRVAFSSFHVTTGSSSHGVVFPGECSGGLSAQEKTLAFMLFDLASCIDVVEPPLPTCTARSCQEAGANCGPVGDGCGGLLDCGACTAPETCGGGGTPSVCGSRTCRALTCADLGFNCGPAGDGCGKALDCGQCPAGQSCGGAGIPGQCGQPQATCNPLTCADQGFDCGPAGDGCGGGLDCGACAAPETCGGAGIPGQCGQPDCTPRTCRDAGAQCGQIGDGCGGALDCGQCPDGQTCGGGGQPNICYGIG